MNNFINIKIGQLGTTITGKTPSSDFSEDFGNEYMFITPSDSFDNKTIYETNRYLSEEGLKKLKNKVLTPKSVLVSCIGSAMGKVTMNHSISITNQQINSIVIDSKYDSDYIYYILKNNYKLLRNASSGSTSLPMLNKTDFDKLIIKIHKDKITQQKIAAVLSSLDAKIETNNRINIELETMAKTLYDYWFVQFDFPDANGNPYKTSGGKMVYSNELKRDIPEGWKVQPLFKAMDVQYGFPFDTSKFTDDTTQKPVIRIRDILENTISTYSTEEVQDKYKLNSKDLLIGMDGNFHLNFWDKDGAYLNQRSVRIRSILNSEISNFQAYFELEPHIKAREKNVSRTTVGHLSDKDLKRLFLVSAIKNENFNPKDTFDAMLEKIISNRIQNQKLTDLRDWLLPMLMNGQVTVEDAIEQLGMVAESVEQYGK